MQEKLKELREKTSERQAKFAEAWIVEGLKKIDAYKKAGFKGKTKGSASTVISRMLRDVNVSNYISALKAERDRKMEKRVSISRTMQLNSLQEIKSMAIELKNPSAAVAAIREMNEMLGYHREKGLNPEKEAVKRAEMDAEEQKIHKLIAEQRTAEEAKERPNVVKIKDFG